MGGDEGSSGWVRLNPDSWDQSQKLFFPPMTLILSSAMVVVGVVGMDDMVDR